MEKVSQQLEKIKQLTKENKFDEALALCSEAVGEFPQVAELYYQKAVILWNKSEVFDLPREEFSDLLKKATDLDPHYSEPHTLWGYANLLLGYPAQAEAGYTRAIAANPQDWEAYAYRGELYKRYEMYDKAVEDFTKAIDGGLAGNRTYAFRADSKYALKDYEGALADYTKGIELNPNYGGGFFGRGRCKYALEDYAGAVEEYNQAIALFPNEASLYGYRADAKMKLDDSTGALADFQKALELNPTDKMALRAVGDLQQKILSDIPEGTPSLEVTLKNGYKASLVTLPNGEQVSLWHLGAEADEPEQAETPVSQESTEEDFPEETDEESLEEDSFLLDMRYKLYARAASAISADDADGLRKLLADGMKPDITDENGYTPLMLACSMGKKQMVEILVEHGADINMPHIMDGNPTGMNALKLAECMGHTEIVNFLKGKGAKA